MTESAPEAQPGVGGSRITSLPLSSRAITACWAFAVILMGAGIVGTFLEKSGAPSATLIALGALLLILALMQRVPLRLEVAGAKIDASYPPDEAYDAGRTGGVVEGLESAIETVENAPAIGSDRGELVRLLRENLELERPLVPVKYSGDEATVDVGFTDASSPVAGIGYRGPTACSAAGITYRQLDYWARTGLVEPSVRSIRGTGSQRLYSVTDVLLLALIRRLSDAGISLQQIRAAVTHLRRYPVSAWDTITLMSDGRSVYEVTSEEELTDLLASGRGMFGISLRSLSADIRSSLADLPAERAQ